MPARPPQHRLAAGLEHRREVRSIAAAAGDLPGERRRERELDLDRELQLTAQRRQREPAEPAADHRRGPRHLLGRRRVAERVARAEPVDADEPAGLELRLGARRDRQRDARDGESHRTDRDETPGAHRIHGTSACAGNHDRGKLAWPMLTFSTDPDVAEQQMNAIIFYLTAFGYIDGDFDFTEKTFVRIYIRQLVTARAKAAMPDADPEDPRRGRQPVRRALPRGVRADRSQRQGAVRRGGRRRRGRREVRLRQAQAPQLRDLPERSTRRTSTSCWPPSTS